MNILEAHSRKVGTDTLIIMIQIILSVEVTCGDCLKIEPPTLKANKVESTLSSLAISHSRVLILHSYWKCIYGTFSVIWVFDEWNSHIYLIMDIIQFVISLSFQFLMEVYRKWGYGQVEVLCECIRVSHIFCVAEVSRRWSLLKMKWKPKRD